MNKNILDVDVSVTYLYHYVGQRVILSSADPKTVIEMTDSRIALRDSFQNQVALVYCI